LKIARNEARKTARTRIGMTTAEAKAIVRDHWDDDNITNEQVEACFRALFGRDPGSEDD
jgi:hypothetical protein